jgi:hypothetical protein
LLYWKYFVTLQYELNVYWISYHNLWNLDC